MASKTAVVILNWNGKSLMEKYLPGVTGHSGDNIEIIIGDNASTDDSVGWLATAYPHVKVISNAVNEGFAKGYNTVLSQVDAEYFMLLNSDVEVTPGWLDPLVTFLDNHPSVAVVQPKIRWEKKPDFF